MFTIISPLIFAIPDDEENVLTSDKYIEQVKAVFKNLPCTTNQSISNFIKYIDNLNMALDGKMNFDAQGIIQDLKDMNSFIVMIGTSFSYIAVCETINAKYGLGWIIQQSSSRGRTDMVFMAIIVITILSVIFDSVGKFLVKKTFKWKYYKAQEE